MGSLPVLATRKKQEVIRGAFSSSSARACSLGLAAMIVCVAKSEELLLRLAEALRGNSFKSFLCLTTADAIRVVSEQSVELVIIDDLLGTGNGMELLQKARSFAPHLPVLLWTELKEVSQLADRLNPDIVVSQANGMDELLKVISLLLVDPEKVKSP